MKDLKKEMDKALDACINDDKLRETIREGGAKLDKLQEILKQVKGSKLK